MKRVGSTSLQRRNRDREAFQYAAEQEELYKLQKIWELPPMAQYPPLNDDHDLRTNKTTKGRFSNLYKPLIPQQTRLLRIDPGKFDQPIVCKLVRATMTHVMGARLDEEDGQKIMVRYSALSYSWGWPVPTCSVLCNNVVFPVTKHLKDAMRHIRDPADTIYLWTDAFCVNQLDLVEKGLQVQLMFTIFQKATRVVGWLGSAPNGSHRLLNFLESGLNLRYLRSSHCYQESRPDQFVGNDAYWDLQAEAVSLVASNQWFRRTWIRQEVFAARNLEMMCGRYTFELSKLVKIVELAAANRKFSTDPSELLGMLTHPSSKPGSERLVSWQNVVLENAAGFEASMDQDRIFALQNIAEPDPEAEGKLFPVIDYTKETAIVYQEFVKRILYRTRDLDILNIFERRDLPRLKNLPAWAPDFSMKTPRMTVVAAGVDDESDDFKCEAKDYNPQSEDLHMSLRETGILRLRGFIVGRLSDDPTSSLPKGDLTRSKVFGIHGFSMPRPLVTSRKAPVPHLKWLTTPEALSEIQYKWTTPQWLFHNPNYGRHICVSEATKAGDLLLRCIGLAGRTETHRCIPASDVCFYVLRKRRRTNTFEFLGPAVAVYERAVIHQFLGPNIVGEGGRIGCEFVLGWDIESRGQEEEFILD